MSIQHRDTFAGTTSLLGFVPFVTWVTSGCWPNLWKRAMQRLSEFFNVYRVYAKHHPRWYAARIAYGIAFKGLPF